MDQFIRLRRPMQAVLRERPRLDVGSDPEELLPAGQHIAVKGQKKEVRDPRPDELRSNPLMINEPAYTVVKLAEKCIDPLAWATKDARGRARAIAWAAGAGIGAITNADTAPFQITASNSNEARISGSTNTLTIDKDIATVMALSFRVE